MNFNYEEEVPEINLNLENDEEDDRLQKELELMLSGSPDQFSDSSYWEKRYTENPNIFEWYRGFNHFIDDIKTVFNFKGIAANIGCGTSTMGIDLLNAGFSHVINTDISCAAINIMKEKFKDVKDVEWIVDDCLDTHLPPNMFDCIFDKGTIDALICNEHPGKIMRKIFNGVLRSLKKGGYFVVISFGDEDDRQSYFEKEEFAWDLVQILTISNDIGTPHFVYICRKR